MNKTRTLLELLKLVLRYTKTETDYYGLCGTVSELYNRELITLREKTKLNKYIDKHPPSDRDRSHGSFYWKKHVKAPRLRWLREHKKLKS